MTTLEIVGLSLLPLVACVPVIIWDLLWDRW